MSDRFKMRLLQALETDEDEDDNAPPEPAQSPFRQRLDAALTAVEPRESKVITLDPVKIEGDVRADEPELSPFDKALRGLRSAGDTAIDAYRGATHGVTMGLADDLVGAVSPQTANEMRAADDFASKRSPTAYALSRDVAGYLPMFLTGGSSAATQLAAPVAQAGAEKFGNSDPNAPLAQRALDAYKSMGVASLLGGATHGVLNGLGAGASGLGDSVESAGVKARGAAYGLGKDEIAEQAKRMGTRDQDAALRALVAEGEKLSPPNAVWGKGAQTYSNDFAQGAKDINRGIDRSLEDASRAGAQLPPDIRGDVSAALYQQNLAKQRTPQWREAPALADEARAVWRQPNPTTPDAVRALKQAYDANAFGAQGGTPESYAELASKAAADQYRGILENYAAQGGPEIAGRYAAGNAEYPMAASLAQSAGDRANQAASSGGWLPPAVGSALGGAAGWLGGGGPVGAALGASAGAMGGRQAGSALGQYGADFAANMAQPVSQLFTGVGQFSTALGQGAGMAGRDLANALSNRASQQQLAQDRQQDQNGPVGMGNTYGPSLGSRARQLLANPQTQADWEPYLDDLQQTVGDDGQMDQGKFDATVERLLRTNPDFRKTFGTRLGAM